jgi:hypothetical protein
LPLCGTGVIRVVAVNVLGTKISGPELFLISFIMHVEGPMENFGLNLMHAALGAGKYFFWLVGGGGIISGV